jgi:hypothetical protein
MALALKDSFFESLLSFSPIILNRNRTSISFATHNAFLRFKIRTVRRYLLQPIRKQAPRDPLKTLFWFPVKFGRLFSGVSLSPSDPTPPEFISYDFVVNDLLHSFPQEIPVSLHLPQELRSLNEAKETMVVYQNDEKLCEQLLNGMLYERLRFVKSSGIMCLCSNRRSS